MFIKLGIKKSKFEEVAKKGSEMSLTSIRGDWVTPMLTQVQIVSAKIEYCAAIGPWAKDEILGTEWGVSEIVILSKCHILFCKDLRSIVVNIALKQLKLKDPNWEGKIIDWSMLQVRISAHWNLYIGTVRGYITYLKPWWFYSKIIVAENTIWNCSHLKSLFYWKVCRTLDQKDHFLSALWKHFRFV